MDPKTPLLDVQMFTGVADGVADGALVGVSDGELDGVKEGPSYTVHETKNSK
jgi:hypothetical protein